MNVKPKTEKKKEQLSMLTALEKIGQGVKEMQQVIRLFLRDMKKRNINKD